MFVAIFYFACFLKSIYMKIQALKFSYELPLFAPGIPCFFRNPVAFEGVFMNLDSCPLFLVFLFPCFLPLLFFGDSNDIFLYFFSLQR